MRMLEMTSVRQRYKQRSELAVWIAIWSLVHACVCHSCVIWSMTSKERKKRTTMKGDTVRRERSSQLQSIERWWRWFRALLLVRTTSTVITSARKTDRAPAEIAATRTYRDRATTLYRVCWNQVQSSNFPIQKILSTGLFKVESSKGRV